MMLVSVAMAVMIVVIVVVTHVIVMAVVVMVVVVVVMAVSIAFFATKVIVALAAVQNFHLNQVEDEGNSCNDKHIHTHNLGRLKESVRCFDKEPDCHDPDSCDRDHGADNLRSAPAVSQVVRGAPLAQFEGDD